MICQTIEMCTIVLNSISFSDEFEGGLEDRRVIEYTLDFTMKTYFFGYVYTGQIIKNVIERTYVNDGQANFTTTEIDESGLVKEVKHYEHSQKLQMRKQYFDIDTAINTNISTGDEVFNTGLSMTSTISSIASNKLSIVLSSAITITDKTRLFFVGSVGLNDTFVVAETVSFFDDGTNTTFADDKTSDAS